MTYTRLEYDCNEGRGGGVSNIILFPQTPIIPLQLQSSTGVYAKRVRSVVVKRFPCEFVRLPHGLAVLSANARCKPLLDLLK